MHAETVEYHHAGRRYVGHLALRADEPGIPAIANHGPTDARSWRAVTIRGRPR